MAAGATCDDDLGPGPAFADITGSPSSLNSTQAIVPGLLISGFAAEAVERHLQDFGVTHVLQVGIELRPSHPGKFVYMHVPIMDAEGVDLVGQLQPMLSFIDNAVSSGGVVLVHCMMGISRSASTCIAYLMWKERLSFVDAATRVYSARPFISPNPGFVLQLRDWERSGMDFAAWRGWSRQKFLEALEEWGGMRACMFDSVMADGGVSLAAVAAAPRANRGVIVPTPAPVKRRPMPTSLTQRMCAIS